MRSPLSYTQRASTRYCSTPVLRSFYLRAYNSRTGEEIWKSRLLVGSQSRPITYRSEKTSKQYVVIFAGGSPHSDKRGDSVIAYALPGPVQKTARSRVSSSKKVEDLDSSSLRIKGAGPKSPGHPLRNAFHPQCSEPVFHGNGEAGRNAGVEPPESPEG
ncbi:hypothetical protein [Pseudomonas fluorescens]|uniref:hypothetical protein n=1 Tax=Pseudomonas fluorescens TaxID=294 RepID=UPI0039900ED5